MNETLEAMARALFKSWFVDFDPVAPRPKGATPAFPGTSLTCSLTASRTRSWGRFRRGGKLGISVMWWSCLALK